VFLSSEWNNGPLSEFYPLLIDLRKLTSDHSPLKHSFIPYTHVPRSFRFDRFWLKFKDTTQIVTETWNMPNHPQTALIKFNQRNTALIRTKWVVQLNDNELVLCIRLNTHIYDLAHIVEEKW
jgi:hypothetical protein